MISGKIHLNRVINAKCIQTYMDWLRQGWTCIIELWELWVRLLQTYAQRPYSLYPVWRRELKTIIWTFPYFVTALLSFWPQLYNPTLPQWHEVIHIHVHTHVYRDINYRCINRILFWTLPGQWVVARNVGLLVCMSTIWEVTMVFRVNNGNTAIQ